MNNLIFDPRIKNTNEEEDMTGQDDTVDEQALQEGDYIEYLNPEDLDAVDPEDIGIGEEYF